MNRHALELDPAKTVLTVTATPAQLVTLPALPHALRTRDSEAEHAQRAAARRYRDIISAERHAKFPQTRRGRRGALLAARRYQRWLDRFDVAAWLREAEAARGDMIAANALAHAANQRKYAADRAALADYKAGQAAAIRDGRWSKLSNESLRDVLCLRGYSIRAVDDRYRCCVAVAFKRTRSGLIPDDAVLAGWDDNGARWRVPLRIEERPPSYEWERRELMWPDLRTAMADVFGCSRADLGDPRTVRQGDVLFVPLEHEIDDALEVHDVTIRGRHVVRGAREWSLGVHVPEGGTVVEHPEHATVALGAGGWRVYTTRNGHGD